MALRNYEDEDSGAKMCRIIPRLISDKEVLITVFAFALIVLALSLNGGQRRCHGYAQELAGCDSFAFCLFQNLLNCHIFLFCLLFGKIDTRWQHFGNVTGLI